MPDLPRLLLIVVIGDLVVEDDIRLTPPLFGVLQRFLEPGVRELLGVLFAVRLNSKIDGEAAGCADRVTVVLKRDAGLLLVKKRSEVSVQPLETRRSVKRMCEDLVSQTQTSQWLPRYRSLVVSPQSGRVVLPARASARQVPGFVEERGSHACRVQNLKHALSFRRRRDPGDWSPLVGEAVEAEREAICCEQER